MKLPAHITLYYLINCLKVGLAPWLNTKYSDFSLVFYYYVHKEGIWQEILRIINIFPH